jgi:ribonucleoside-diphosphate reductase alpha chain
VESGADWPLVFPDASLEEKSGAETLVRRWPGFERPVACRVIARLPARQLWQRIMRSCYASAEPGVLFVDQINRLNNLAYREYITTTNPCGEVPLPPYGACNLGSLNLTQFVLDPFTNMARMDMGKIGETARIATRLLDNIIDISRFPLDAQRRQATGSRRIGLGITGLADALIMLGLHYDSGAGRAEASRIMETICHAAYETSIGLAREKTPFPWFEREAYLRSGFVQSLPGRIRDAIGRDGIRNSHLTAIAPTGTISLLAGNISSGVEPLFDTVFSRKVLNRDGAYETFELEDYAFRQWRAMAGAAEIPPPQFVRATDLSPQAHLQMQAALQPFVDSAIAKTVNVPQDCSFDEFKDLYRSAWRYGLKGCAAFRPNPVTGSILVSDKRDGAVGCEPRLHCCSLDGSND